MGTPTTPEGVLIVDADNPSGLPENDFRVTVPLTFGRALLGAPYAGFRAHKVVSGDTLSGIAQDNYGDANLWPRLFIANRDTIDDPDLIRVGQVLRDAIRQDRRRSSHAGGKRPSFPPCERRGSSPPRQLSLGQRLTSTVRLVAGSPNARSAEA